MKRVGPRVDPDLPGRAGVEEAGRSPHGLRQGRPGVLGCRVKPGRIMFEIDGVSGTIAKEAFDAGRRQAADQDPFVTRLGRRRAEERHEGQPIRRKTPTS
jgi:large subunit ribosomal protein L16